MNDMTPQDAIDHPNFSHSRQGSGCWREIVWIYHRDRDSPSGVKLASSGPSSVVDQILRARRNTSPLSPAEHA